MMKIDKIYRALCLIFDDLYEIHYPYRSSWMSVETVCQLVTSCGFVFCFSPNDYTPSAQQHRVERRIIAHRFRTPLAKSFFFVEKSLRILKIPENL